jgi:uncharacterized protein YjbI with pentapeptide repeats
VVDLIVGMATARQAIFGHDRIAAFTGRMTKLAGPVGAHVGGVSGADNGGRRCGSSGRLLSPVRYNVGVPAAEQHELIGADLRGADLNNANLNGADLCNANLSEADSAGRTSARLTSAGGTSAERY